MNVVVRGALCVWLREHLVATSLNTFYSCNLYSKCSSIIPYYKKNKNNYNSRAKNSNANTNSNCCLVSNWRTVIIEQKNWGKKTNSSVGRLYGQLKDVVKMPTSTDVIIITFFFKSLLKNDEMSYVCHCRSVKIWYKIFLIELSSIYFLL